MKAGQTPLQAHRRNDPERASISDDQWPWTNSSGSCGVLSMEDSMDTEIMPGG